ncbi:hypothetical protein NPM01_24205 [Bacillus cereus]|nr:MULTISPECIES: hypothetical protein [Bacillus cereus group]MCQ6359707.1 hypothetical protein [Bacillus cereus]
MAEELGIKHPADPIIMTTNFLLTVSKGWGITVVKAKHSSKGFSIWQRFYPANFGQ